MGPENNVGLRRQAHNACVTQVTGFLVGTDGAR